MSHNPNLLEIFELYEIAAKYEARMSLYDFGTSEQANANLNNNNEIYQTGILARNLLLHNPVNDISSNCS